MYKRFIRWASDRLADDGIIGFVSNSAFLDARQDDGFRKVVAQEFNELWVIDLKGNARTSGERRQREAGNGFDDKIRVGRVLLGPSRRLGWFQSLLQCNFPHQQANWVARGRTRLLRSEGNTGLLNPFLIDSSASPLGPVRPKRRDGC